MRFGLFIEKAIPDDELEDDSERMSIEASPKSEILLEEMRRRYDLQQCQIDAADTKSGLILVYYATVFVVFVSSALSFEQAVTQSPNVYILISVALAAFSYLIGAVCCVVAIIPRTFFFPVGAEVEEIEFYLSKSRDEMILQLLRQYSEYIQRNHPRIKYKYRWFLWALIFSVIFTVSGICAVLLVQL
jgi:hypothetical protein